MDNLRDDLWSVVLGCASVAILVVFVIGGAVIAALPFQGESTAAFIFGGVIGLILAVLVILGLKKIW